MYKLGINFDEISDDLGIALQTMQDQHVKYGELRTVQSKNFVFWSDEEVQVFKDQVRAAGIQLVAASTPLFKWYDNPDDPEVKHDNFGFNPRLSDAEKKRVIERAIEVADVLEIPRLRIFSGLGVTADAGATFAHNVLLTYALELADAKGIDLYLENEPVCKVNNKKEIQSLFAENTHSRLKFWLDIANMVEINEEIDAAFIAQVVSRLGYLHVKDFVISDGQRCYVPAGSGIIDYVSILKSIYAQKDDGLVVTVETHAQTDKIGTSIASINGTRGILSAADIAYE